MISFTTFLLLLASSQLSTAAAVQGNVLSGILTERAGCGNPKLASDYSACYTYCDTSTSQVNGAAIAASDRVICNLATCTDAYANAVTITEGFTVTDGFATTPITETASFDWSKSVSSTNTYSFTLSDGDDGHIEFIPLLNQICGTLTSYSFTTGQYGDICVNDKTGVDPNACGTSGIKLNDGTAEGTYTFCNTNGTGCNPFTKTSDDKLVLS